MGSRGPTPTPAAVKRARGETRPSRLRAVEPIPRAGDPVMPPDLDEEAIVIWRRVVADAPPGLIRPIDGDLLAGYCEAVALYRRTIRWQRIDDDLVLESKRADSARWVRHPLVSIARDAREEMRRLGRELGFSPAARANIRMDPKTESENVWADVGVPPHLKVLVSGR